MIAVPRPSSLSRLAGERRRLKVGTRRGWKGEKERKRVGGFWQRGIRKRGGRWLCGRRWAAEHGEREKKRKAGVEKARIGKATLLLPWRRYFPPTPYHPETLPIPKP
ncbi:hypothetical protein MRB53_011837 [Persea americana]|uniref:Uncharacterized protein n=1 Tax=Persea americana TaxID=3435 RepID=A0ACC2LW02_PERAE|nr:hypothetical protein MRB53_011837 [Persea americana]